jgi:hypothetical protein
VRPLQKEKAQKAQALLITTLIPILTPQLTDMEFLKDDTQALYEMEVEVKLLHRSLTRALIQIKLMTLTMILMRM